MKAVKSALRATLPVMAGYIFLGIAFGVLLNQNGYNAWWALAMSVFIYAGSMQMVGVSLLATGADFFTVVMTTLAVNARHIFYGLAMLDRVKGMGKFRHYMIFSLTDETFSVLCSEKAPKGVDEDKFAFFCSLFDQIYWVIGCVLGTFIGESMGKGIVGVEFVMTSFFVVIFVEQWLQKKNRTAQIVGVLVSIVCLLLLGQDKFLIPAMLVIAAVLILMKNIKKQAKEGENV